MKSLFQCEEKPVDAPGTYSSQAATIVKNCTFMVSDTALSAHHNFSLAEILRFSSPSMPEFLSPDAKRVQLKRQLANVTSYIECLSAEFIAHCETQ